MNKMTIKIAAAVGALFLANAPAQAQLFNYTFSPGSYFNFDTTNTYAATGGFTFDAGTNTISNVTYTAIQTGTRPGGPYTFTSGTVVSPTQVTFSGDGFGDSDTFLFAQSLALGGTDQITGGWYNEDTQISAGGSVTSGVPEPATWAMMLIGFGALGIAMRRKPKQVYARG